MRLFKKSNLLHILYRNAITYPAPSNLTYFWNFGFLSLIALVIQILTGIFLAMHYTGNIDYAFNSVEHIMRDVNNGWLIRYVHANGASLFFLLVYVHMFRGMYYSSYAKPREFLWIVGVIILLIMILTAFMGYVLPWGQMSFWAATVITNLASAIPVVGLSVVEWLWGGFSVGNPTLNRFFSFHYLFPFVLVGLVLVHIILLHEKGSNNPLGIDFRNDLLPFDPYFTIKDFFSLILVFIFLFIFVAFMPNVAGHPDNYIPANPMVTPTHIVPEWYFLPFYAILRSVPDKLGGVTLLLLSILILILLPFIHRPVVRSFLFRPLSKFFFWFFFFNCLILGWIGGQPIEPPYLEVGRYSTVFYFVYLVILLPGVNLIEKTLFGFTDK